MEVVYWALVSICFILLFLTILVEQLLWNPAHADYLNYIKFRIESEKPDICIAEPDDPEINFYKAGYFNATIQGLAEWETKLKQHNVNFDMNFYLLLNKTHVGKSTNEFKYCDVFITFEKSSNSAVLGTTHFILNKSVHKYSYITIYTQENYTSPTIDIGNKVIVQTKHHSIFSAQLVNQIVKHEFGHAMGLGHKMKTLDNHFDTIMKPALGRVNEITVHDLNAILHLYPDGFQRFYNDAIPEPYSLNNVTR